MINQKIVFHPYEKKTVVLTCEVADTFIQKSQGLMYRSSLKPTSGMLFPFSYTWFRIFWMKNVIIPLDIIFINRDLQIVKIRSTFAKSHPFQKSYWAVGWAKYILECNQGFCETNAISVGTTISFEDNS